MSHSLRLRLLVRTSLAVAAVLGLLGIALYVCVRESANSAFNQALLTEARGVAATAEQHDGKIIFDYAPDELPKFAASVHPDYFQAWIDAGVVIRSPSLGAGDLPRPPSENGVSYRDAVLPDGRPGRMIGCLRRKCPIQRRAALRSKWNSFRTNPRRSIIAFAI